MKSHGEADNKKGGEGLGHCQYLKVIKNLKKKISKISWHHPFQIQS
jgi:hypothetical protein